MRRYIFKRLLVTFISVSFAAGLRVRQDPDGATGTQSPPPLKDETTAKPYLTFSQQGSFKIMQLTDMHLGEAQETDWGPRQDIKTYNLLSSLIPFEYPDLILLTGDQLTGNDCDENATAYYEHMGKFLETFGIPWALTFGNHDDADLTRNLNGSSIEAKTKRPQLADALKVFPLSLTKFGPSNVTGTTNFVLPIHPADGASDEILSQIVLLDSGGGSIPTRFDTSQVDWFREQLDLTPVPSVVFQHIPTVEFKHDEERCVGTQKDGVAYLTPDSGMMDTMERDPNVLLLAAGHNHGNDYCCRMDDTNLHLCFGRHSGYGGYTAVDRGARVYELKLAKNSGSSNLRALKDGTKLLWNSWVRLETGEVLDEYNPFEVKAAPPFLESFARSLESNVSPFPSSASSPIPLSNQDTSVPSFK